MTTRSISMDQNWIWLFTNGFSKFVSIDNLTKSRMPFGYTQIQINVAAGKMLTCEEHQRREIWLKRSLEEVCLWALTFITPVIDIIDLFVILWKQHLHITDVIKCVFLPEKYQLGKNIRQKEIWFMFDKSLANSLKEINTG